MKTKQFEFVIDRMTEFQKTTLGVKALEYADAKGDRLQNFKDAAKFEKCTPEQALLGMVTKHLVALSAYVRGEVKTTPAGLFEKITDTAVYMDLLAAIYYESNPDFAEYFNERTDNL